MLENKKADALKAYKEAKEEYLKNATRENWIRFCDRKRDCILLGVKI